MGESWTPEHPFELEDARRLLAARFPELRPIRARVLGAGWDNLAVEVESANGPLVFRFPRRAIAGPLLEAEVRWLSTLAPALSVAIPVPTHVGAPADGYPYVWAGYPLLHGEDATRLAPDDPARHRLAVDLGRFLRALHEVPTPPDAPPDTIQRADTGAIRRRLLARLPRVAGPDAPRFERVAEALIERADAHAPGVPRWQHGDCYALHQLVEADGTLVGVIDWGDVHVGDPAVDLAAAFHTVPPTARSAFFEAYALQVDDGTRARARVRALQHSVALFDYARETGRTRLQTCAAAAIDWCVSPGNPLERDDD